MAALLHAAQRSATFRPGLGLRLALPIAMVVMTLLLADALRWVFPGSGLFLLLLVPVLLASIGLGAVAGLVALGMSAAGALIVVALRAHPWLSEPSDLLRAVPFVFLGGFIVLVASVLRASLSRQAPVHRGATTLIEPLTEREAEVLALAAGGLSTDDVADRLFLSRNTVKSHFTHAYAKLGAHNRMEAIAAAVHARAIDGSVLVARAPEITESSLRHTAGAPAPAQSGALPGAVEP